MPFGDNDWLALTQETTLEPDLPICDPHHHFWDFRSVRIPYQRYLLSGRAGWRGMPPPENQGLRCGPGRHSEQ